MCILTICYCRTVYLTHTGLPVDEVEESETTAAFSYTTTSSHTTMSTYASTSSDGTTTHRYRDTRPDCHEIQRAQFDKLQVELKELRLSFERSLRQMESRTHSLLWSVSRRLERMTEARDRNSDASHRPKTLMTLGHFLSSSVAAVTPSSEPPGRRPWTCTSEVSMARKAITPEKKELC